MSDVISYKNALRIFVKQMECIKAEDHIEQMKLYSEDLHYEFPFANDRPNIIDGKDSFYEIMEPLWTDAHSKNVLVEGYKYDFFSTNESNVFVAFFTINAKIGTKSISIPFVQKIEINNNRIKSVIEYFNPRARSEI